MGKEYWEKIKEKGVLNFIIKRGFFGFSLPGALFYATFTSHKYQKPFLDVLPKAFSLFIFVGFGFALLLWYLMKRKYDHE